MGTDTELEPKPKTGAEIVDDALNRNNPVPETVGRVDAPDNETAEESSEPPAQGESF